MSGVRDLFFDEFYSELERVAGEKAARREEEQKPSILADDVRARWIQYTGDGEREGTLIRVDGGTYSRATSPTVTSSPPDAP